MSEQGKILAIIEPEMHPQQVVARATWLAAMNGSDLLLALCDPDIGPVGEGFFLSNEARDIQRQIVAAQGEIIEELAEVPRAQGVTVTTTVIEERPIAEAIIHLALNQNPLYVVKGTHYHSVAERSIFVDTDWHLIRGCPFPLWLVKPNAISDQPLVIASVDPTHSHDKPAALDRAIVEHAKQIADATGGDVHLLHTYRRIAGVGKEATRTFKPIKLPIEELDQKIQNEHREKLDQLAHECSVDAEHVHQLPGTTREILPTFARSKKADLVVMGALARWGLKKAIIGSTAERVLDHLPCDTLIVRA